MRSDRLLSTGLATAWVLLLGFAAFVLVDPWPDVVLWIDFSSFWMAASFIRDGAGAMLYDPVVQQSYEVDLRQHLAQTEFVRSMQGFNPYPNLPLLALPYLPLTYLPMPSAYLIWWGLSFVTFFAAVTVPLRGRRFGRTVAVLALSFAPVTTTLFEGQPYGFFLLVLVLALLSFREDRPLLGGALLGVFWLKPQYAVLFPMLFIIKRRWSELAGMTAVGLLVLVSSVALVGLDGMVAYIRLLNHIGGFSYEWVNPFAMVNWRAVLINLWPGIPDPVGQSLVLLLGAATVMVSLLVWRGPWNASSPVFARQVMVLLLALLVASPHSHIHGAVMLLAPIVAGAGGTGEDDNWSRANAFLAGAGYILAFAVWPGGVPRWILAPFFLVVMATLLWQHLRHQAPRNVEEPVSVSA